MNRSMTCPVIVSIFVLLMTTTMSAREFHVSPRGDDAHAGTRAQPFKTVQRARDAIRALKKSSGLPVGGITVRIHGGIYFMAGPLKLGKEDAGTETAPIVYRSVKDEMVRLSGARRVPGFEAVTDRAVLDRLDPAARGQVMVADLRAAGIVDHGKVTSRGERFEVFFRDQPMQLARWPNEGFVRIVDVIGSRPFVVHGIAGNRDGIFTFSDERPTRWVSEKDIRLHGYWFWDWSDSYERVQKIDLEKKSLQLAAPFHHYGYRKGQRYYALNLLSEIDTPGEWFLDRQQGLLYFWPPATPGNGDTVVTMLQHLIVIEDCPWVSFRGLTLEGTRSHVITMNGGSSDLVADCVIRNGGSWGVRISGGSNHGVRSCELYRLGEGGIGLSGGDRKTLTPARHVAENNHIHHFGRLYRTYRPAVGISGVGNRIAHNLIHHGPHNAIQLGGNDHIIEFNEIHHVCFETGDVGAFYMGRNWTERGTIIRHNFFHDISGPGLHGAMAVYLDDAASGITIFGNVFLRSGRSAFIGGGRDNLVDNNIFVDCQPSVHVDARGAGWMRNHIEKTMPDRLRAVPYKSEIWRRRYPELLTVLDDEPGLPKGNIVRRNLSVGGKWLNIESKAKPLVVFEDNLIDRDPLFVGDPRGEDATILDFWLRENSPAYKLGFQPIPLERIGLQKRD